MHCLIRDPSAVGTQQIAASVTVVAASSGYGSIQLLADAFPGPLQPERAAGSSDLPAKKPKPVPKQKADKAELRAKAAGAKPA